LVNNVFFKNLVSLNYFNNHFFITLKNVNDIIPFSLFLRNNLNCQFEQLLDIWAIDNLLLADRFIVYYKFTSLKFNETIFCRFSTKLDTQIPSLIYFFFQQIG